MTGRSSASAETIALAPTRNQRNIWLGQAASPDAPLYNELTVFLIDGALDRRTFDRALQEVIDRTDAMRIVVDPGETVDGVPHLRVLDKLDYQSAFLDLSGADDGEAALAAWAQRYADTVLDLEERVFDSTLVKLSQDRFAWALLQHHVASDASSMSIIYERVGHWYGLVRSGAGHDDGAYPSFGEYMSQVRRLASEEGYASIERFWQQRISDPPTAMEFYDGVSPSRARARRRTRHELRLDVEECRELRRFAARDGVRFVSDDLSLFSVFAATLFVQLHRISGEGRRSIGVPWQNRGHETADTVGLLMEQDPFTVVLDDDDSFLAAIAKVHREALAHLRHLPFAAGNPGGRLYDVTLNVLKASIGPFDGLAVEPHWYRPSWGEGSLHVQVHDLVGSGGLTVSFDFDADLFTPGRCAAAMAQFRWLLQTCTADPAAAVSAIEALPPEERARLDEWNRTERPYPRDQTVVELFEAQARRRPEDVAATCGGRSLTYADLDQRADVLAARLRDAGARPGAFVGICLHRSVEMLVSVLGVMKSGAAYVPLDPTFPPQRLALMLSDSGASILVTEPALEGAVDESGLCVVEPEAAPASPATSAPILERPGPDDLAYVLYTSGSTGRPKGVQIPHRALTNFLWSMRSEPGCDENDVLLAVTTLSFDIAGLELYLPLVCGGRVDIATRAEATDGRRLLECLDRGGITMLQATPAAWRMLLDAGWTGTNGLKALVGGEPLPPDLVRPLLERTASLWNMYGPTETTIWSSVDRIDSADDPITIGRPIGNTTFHILDPHGRRTPIGVAGELCIGGDGLAVGYHDRPDLTAERFVPDPFSGQPAARMYRTGDVARFGDDGRVVHLGRADQQVKVRGFRIELGEVEAVLATHPSVQSAVVSARGESPDSTVLVGYYVAGPQGPPDADQLRGHLRTVLPDYMVPTFLVPIERVPLTPNGKVDRRALPAPQPGSGSRPATLAPRTPVERSLAAIWSKLLGVPEIGLHDDFFELGGHSLLAQQMLNRVVHELGVDIPLHRLFEAGTLQAVARQAEAASAQPGSGQTTSIEALPRVWDEESRYVSAASFGQERLWVLYQLERDSAAYTIPAAFRVEGALDVRALESGVRALVARHESLRTTFGTRGSAVVQIVSAASEPDIQVVDIRGGAGDRELQSLLGEEVNRPFVLETGPLLRVRVYRLAEEQHVVLVTVHHIVADGVSMSVLMRELGAVYADLARQREPALTPLDIQPADHAAWQRRTMQGVELERLLGYWRERLAGLTTLELPTDRPRPRMQSFAGATVPVQVAPQLLARLTSLGSRHHTTPFVVLAAAFQVLLHRLSGQRDIALGVPVADRGRRELEDQVGFLVNNLVLRGDLVGEPTFLDVVARTREATAGAFAHDGLPFEKLVDDLMPSRDLSRNPLFQVMFSMQQQPGGAAPDLPGCATSAVALPWETAKVDLSLYLTDVDEGARGFVEYNRDLFDRRTVELMTARFDRLLHLVAEDPTRRIDDLDVLVDDERNRLVVEFNQTAADVPTGANVVQLISQQARRRPDATAVVCDGVAVSYGELDRWSGQVASWLREHGARPGSLVGVCVPRSTQMLAAVLGVMKVGAGYVPLDPDFPSDRLLYMASDAGLELIVATEASRGRVPAFPGEVLSIDGDAPRIRRLPDQAALAQDPDSLAYVLYTSGSTGRPKGVEIPHRALTNFLWSMRSTPGFTQDDVLLAVTTLSFDIAGLELFLPLVCGGRVELATRAVATDGRRLARLLEDSGATVMQATPATWRMLIDAGWQGNGGLRALCGGEPLPRDLADQLLGRVAELWNMYGPTETTIWSSVQRVTADQRTLTIGRPIANTEMYVVDDQLRLQPIGVPGELLIGGEGLARGYRNRPDLTGRQFIPHPFSDAPGRRLYRTGDLARYRHDGELVHLGRLDNQVKVRGFRIELGEIETFLDEHPAVRSSVVNPVPDASGNTTLVAYVIAADPAGPASTTELRRHLKTSLPDYMVPSAFVGLDTLPLTPNGKVDRRALPKTDLTRLDHPRIHQAPSTPEERALAAIWSDVLAVDTVGVHDDFFELGGHSLLALQMLNRVAEELGADVPLHSLFEASTLETVARTVEAARGRAQREGEAFLPALTAIWCDVLGVSDLGADDDFLRIQGERDRVDEMLARVRREVGDLAEGVSASEFRRRPTLQGLAAALGENQATPSSLVVPLSSDGGSTPLFLVHAGGGYVFFYRALAAELGPGRRVYGIRAEQVDEDRGRPYVLSGSIEEVAARYVEEITDVQPVGPYLVGGACAGGLIAFEVARQLIARGERLAGPVVVFDAVLPNNPHVEGQDLEALREVGLYDEPLMAALRRSWARQLRGARGMGPWSASTQIARSLLRRVARETRRVAAPVLGRLRSRVPSGHGVEGLPGAPGSGSAAALEDLGARAMSESLAASVRISLEYQPRPVDVAVVCFEAGTDGLYAGSWEGVATRGLTARTTGGEHLEMMEHPLVVDVAARLNQDLWGAGGSAALAG